MSEKSAKNKVFVPILITVILLITFFFPRFIVRQWGTSNPWSCYLYQYVFGGITFGIGLFLALKSKACRLGRGRDSRWFKWLIGGFTLLLVVHALWILLAVNVPVMTGN